VLAIVWIVVGVVLTAVGVLVDMSALSILAAVSLGCIVIAALLEVATDNVQARLEASELAEFGRKRFAEVRQCFPRVEGIDALAKNKPREEVRRDVPESWQMRVVPREPSEPDEEDGAGDGPADGGGG
jgi:hypothetical protein